jgi:hypothetical protein
MVRDMVWRARRRYDSFDRPAKHARRYPRHRQAHARDRTRSLHSCAVATYPADNSEPQYLELPVEELFRRARALPDHAEMVIEDLSEEEGEAFLAAVQS